jgi:hypothetical protein
MNMAHVRALALFAVDPPAAFSVYLDGFRTERSARPAPQPQETTGP